MAAVFILAAPLAVQADDFDDYKTAAGYEAAAIDLPTVSSFGIAVDYFPAAATAMIDGQFEAAGRLIVANGTEILMQRTYGSGAWDVVATVPVTMDPSFIHPSPDGSLIALGLGYNKDLLIVPTSVLSFSSPPDLTTAPGVIAFENVSYYDGDWVDVNGIDANRYFIVDGGSWPSGPGNCTPGVDPDCDGVCEEPYHTDPDCVFTGGVGAVDIQAADPATHTGVLLGTHDGASADVEVTTDGELLIAIGWLPNPTNRTGEIKVWANGEWDPTQINSLNYAANTRILANNLLSGAWMGQDAEGNLHVGGGDAFGTGGAAENGYAALVEEQVVGDIADGTRTTPVIDVTRDGSNALVDSTEVKFFAPDPYEDDSATGILAGNWGRGLAVMWNPTGTGAKGSASDYWGPGVIPSLTVYYPGSALVLPFDQDGDGIPNTSDNAYLTPNPGQEDADNDGYGNIADADFDNNNSVGGSDFNYLKSNWGGSDPVADMDSNGSVGGGDFNLFKGRWGDVPPYY
jgi:hypothetical protein